MRFAQQLLVDPGLVEEVVAAGLEVQDDLHALLAGTVHELAELLGRAHPRVLPVVPGFGAGHRDDDLEGRDDVAAVGVVPGRDVANAVERGLEVLLAEDAEDRRPGLAVHRDHAGAVEVAQRPARQQGRLGEQRQVVGDVVVEPADRDELIGVELRVADEPHGLPAEHVSVGGGDHRVPALRGERHGRRRARVDGVHEERQLAAVELPRVLDGIRVGEEVAEIADADHLAALGEPEEERELACRAVDADGQDGGRGADRDGGRRGEVLGTVGVGGDEAVGAELLGHLESPAGTGVLRDLVVGGVRFLGVLSAARAGGPPGRRAPRAWWRARSRPRSAAAPPARRPAGRRRQPSRADPPAPPRPVRRTRSSPRSRRSRPVVPLGRRAPWRPRGWPRRAAHRPPARSHRPRPRHRRRASRRRPLPCTGRAGRARRAARSRCG